jgi:ABC-type dipeptide/oligopeptide/nickel transport system permease subunit
MKTIATIVNTVTVLFATLTSAIASASPGNVDTSLTFNSGILVLAFAGFLALVVVVQTIPAIITLYSMIKAAASESSKSQVADFTTHK